MREKKRVTDKALLQGNERQYKNLRKQQGHVFTQFERDTILADERRILKDIGTITKSFELNDYSQSTKNIGKGKSETNSDVIETNSKPSSAVALLENQGNDNSDENYDNSAIIKDVEYDSNQNISGFVDLQADNELNRNAESYEKAMRKAKCESANSEQDKIVAFIFAFVLVVCFIRIWYEKTNDSLPHIIMIGLNLFAIVFTLLTICKDINKQFVKWISKNRIESFYKEFLIHECKRFTRMHFVYSMLFILVVFLLGAYKGYTDMVNDLITILALAISMSCQWITGKYVYYMESHAKSNITF